MTGFAMTALIMSLILMFFLSANHRRSLDDFRRQIAGLTTEIIGLRQEITELNQYEQDEKPDQALSQTSEETLAIPEN